VDADLPRSSAVIRRSLPLKRVKQLLGDSLTVFWGDWLDLRVRIPQVAASGLISPLIYILAFGLGLGSSLDQVSQPTAGDTYLEFILPGMVALSSMVISFGGTTFSICGDRLFTKTFSEMLLYPVHPLALHLGKMLAGIVRGMMTATSVILVAVIFTGKLWSFINPLFLLLLVLNCAVFAGLGVIVGLNVKSSGKRRAVQQFLDCAHVFFGGDVL
jgi:ABC-2 type transport system permease protein